MGNSTSVRLSALAMAMPSDNRNLLLPNCSLRSNTDDNWAKTWAEDPEPLLQREPHHDCATTA